MNVVLSIAAAIAAAVPFAAVIAAATGIVAGRRLANRNVRLLEGAQHRVPTASEVNRYRALREAWLLAQDGHPDADWRHLKSEIDAWRSRQNFAAIAALANAPSGRHTQRPLP